MKKVVSIILILVLALSVLSGCAKEKEASKVATVGFIYVGPIGDGGWTYAHDQGRQYLEKELGVKTIYKESVPESEEVKQVVRDMVDQGATIIYATSFGYMDYIETASKEFPDVKFFHCSGYKTTENMANYFGRIYQPRYLSGIVAGLKTTTNRIGYVAAFPIPEVISGINAFTLGARSVNPDVVVEVVWTSTWFDPAKEKEAAIAAIDKGADVIAQHQDTAGPQQAAEEKGLFSVGYNSDMSKMAPKAYMTAPVWNWGPLYVQQVQSVLDGKFEAKAYFEGMDNGIVQLAPLTALAPAEAKEKVEAIEKTIKDKTWDVFTGPIKNQAGEVVIADGAKASDADILGMSWFVEGVEGSIE